MAYIQLSNAAVDSIINVPINGADREFILVHSGNPNTSIYDSSCSGVWALMKECCREDSWGSNQNIYETSGIHQYLNGEFYNSIGSINGCVMRDSNIKQILTNITYKGDALLQKEFTVDFLQKKMKKNEGEVPQYYVEGNHEAIITPAAFDLVQAELAKRSKGATRYSGVSIFSNKIKCADCGGWYGSKAWHSTDQYRKVIYRCNRKYNGDKCQTPHVTEDEVKAAFGSAYNQLVTEKKEIIANVETIRRTLCRTDALEEEKRALEDEMSIAAERAQGIIAENAGVALDQSEYQERYGALVGRYNAAKARYDEVVDAIAAKTAQSERLLDFIRTM